MSLDDRNLVATRRSWAYRLIHRCTEPPPAYGSREWLALPEGDHAKIAAVVVAAECWRLDDDELERRLADEMDCSREAIKAGEDAAYVARAQAHRRRTRQTLSAPRATFAERRAEELASAAPRQGDYLGRRA